MTSASLQTAGAACTRAEIPPPPPAANAGRPRFFPAPLRSRAIIALAITLLAITVALQAGSGAFSAEFAGYADEPSHYVTGLMVRDYLAGGWHTPPLQFAREYYSRYPKVAFGHWPPVFYIVQAAWMTAFGPSRVSILLLMAFVTAALATSLALAVRAAFGWLPGLLAGCVLVALPHVQKQTILVMPELLLSLFAFTAVLQLVRYMETGARRNALAFSALACLSILTKGNGLAVLLVPPLCLLLTRNRRLLDMRFVAFGALTVCVCAAWQFFSTPFIRHVWTPGASTLPLFGLNLVDALAQCAQLAGVPLTALAVVGAAVTSMAPLVRKRPVPPLWAALVSLIVAVCVFNAVVPLPVAHRKLLMALPAVLMLMVAGLAALSGRLRQLGKPRWPLWAAVAAALLLTGTFTLVRKEARGFIAAADALLPAQHGASYLVSATASGEGAFIAEIAMRDVLCRARVLRATKTLADMDWNGGEYKLRVRSAAEMREYLARSAVSAIVVEDHPDVNGKPHHMLLKRVIQDHPDEWTPLPLVGSSAPAAGVRSFRRASGRSMLYNSIAAAGGTH